MDVQPNGRRRDKILPSRLWSLGRQHMGRKSLARRRISRFPLQRLPLGWRQKLSKPTNARGKR